MKRFHKCGVQSLDIVPVRVLARNRGHAQNGDFVENFKRDFSLRCGPGLRNLVGCPQPGAGDRREQGGTSVGTRGSSGELTLQELWPSAEGLTDLRDQQEDLGVGTQTHCPQSPLLLVCPRGWTHPRPRGMIRGAGCPWASGMGCCSRTGRTSQRTP